MSEPKKMLRLIIRRDNASMAVNTGGSVHVTYKTVDIVASDELIAALTHYEDLEHVQIIGAEEIQ